MKKINWTPFLVLTPIFVLMVIIHYLHYWTPLSILAFMVCFFKAIIFISLDRLLVRIMKIKIKHVWFIELFIIVTIIIIAIHSDMSIMEWVLFVL